MTRKVPGRDPEGRNVERAEGLFVTKAHAIIGRAATPMSYAGVARRTTRRAHGAAADGAGVAAPAYGAPGECVQVVDADGRLMTQCH